MALNAFTTQNTTENIDDSSPVVAGDTYPAMQSVIVDTAATGDYVDINGKSAANDAPVSVRIPNGNANAVVSAGAEITVAEFLLVEIITAANLAEQFYDETSAVEYKVAWGGSNGGTNASSSSVYVAPDDTITLDHDGDYTFDVLPYQTTFSQENGTATGGIFYLKNSAGSTIEALTFPWKKRDSNYTNFPYEGGRQTIFRENMTAGTYRLGFTSHAGSGGGNRVSYNGYAHVIVRRSSLVPTSSLALTVTNKDSATTGQTLQANGDGSATFKSSGTIYDNIADQPVPDANKNTYAVDLPALEVGDKFTVVMARGVLIYNLIGRFIGFGFEHEFIFDGIVWRVEIVGTQLRIEAFSGGGSQAVKAIFIER